MITAVAAIAPLSVLGVALTARSWWEGVTMAVGYLLTLGVLREWSLDGYPRRAIFALMFTTAAWVIGGITASSPISFVPLSLIGALLIVRLPRWKLWIAAFATGVAAIGATAFVFHPLAWDLVAGYLVIPAVGTLFITGVILVSEQAWQVARRLERAKEAEADLAVARERGRFASDLHDIQGHTLHVIKLKAALAGRIVHTDPERAEGELREIRRLADATITESRELAYARHEMSLAAELENAKRLGEAAGIAVHVQLDQGTGGTANPLLAQVLREAMTNLLRHAHPTTVVITASSDAVEVVNDGLAADGDSPLRGLARLRERVEGEGGTMRIERRSDSFVVAARIPADRSETAQPDSVRRVER
ncbi:sensor histidine kinase [Microbacterium sp. EST19A]|uniref:sensor histidine kinase n=1 Tax=Microbacterium sp. EST19A TaxID=2862681 RepID=UPI001CBFD966|nr:histidine kinase [Microbacterium sp. EST19A]